MLKNVLPLNVRNYIDGGEKEDKLKNVISKFVCSRNVDVEKFLKTQAIDYTKKNQSVSYLVFSANTGETLGYYTIAIKPISVKADKFSNTMNKKIARVSDYDEKTGTYNLSAYLIAQIGKNFAEGLSEGITGPQLLQCALDTIKELQYSAGGMVYFLEAENEEKLIKFYEDNGFKKFDTRRTKRKLNDAFGNDMELLIKRVNKMKSNATSFKNCTGISENMDGTVKFIFVTK